MKEGLWIFLNEDTFLNTKILGIPKMIIGPDIPHWIEIVAFILNIVLSGLILWKTLIFMKVDVKNKIHPLLISLVMHILIIVVFLINSNRFYGTYLIVYQLSIFVIWFFLIKFIFKSNIKKSLIISLLWITISMGGIIALYIALSIVFVIISEILGSVL